MNKKELELFSWVSKGSQREAIIKSMDKPMTPTHIKNKTELALNNVSDILRLFVKNKIAKCLNEKEKLGRVYVLTKEGKKIRNMF